MNGVLCNTFLCDFSWWVYKYIYGLTHAFVFR